MQISGSEKYFSDSGKWPFHTPPIHTPLSAGRAYFETTSKHLSQNSYEIANLSFWVGSFVRFEGKGVAPVRFVSVAVWAWNGSSGSNPSSGQRGLVSPCFSRNSEGGTPAERILARICFLNCEFPYEKCSEYFSERCEPCFCGSKLVPQSSRQISLRTRNLSTSFCRSEGRIES